MSIAARQGLPARAPRLLGVPNVSRSARYCRLPMTNKANGVYYFLGNITSHVVHALPLHERIGGTFVVLSEKARSELAAQSIESVAIDDRPDEWLKLSRRIGATVDMLDERADVVLFYEMFLLPRKLRASSCSKVFLWHGNFLKPFMTMNRMRRRAVKGYDHIAALGPVNRDRLIADGVVDPDQLVDLGIARTDEVVRHRGQVVVSSEMVAETGLDPARPIVSYLPTYWGVSSIDTVGKDIVGRFPDHLTLIFRPHPQTPADLLDEYTELVGDRSNIVFAPHGRYEHLGLLETLNASSLIIGDVSSVMLEAILLDKPLLFARDPSGADEADLEPIRTLVEAAGQITVSGVDDLTTLLDTTMAKGIDVNVWQRTKDAMFFHHDGTSVAAIAAFVESLR
jgi:CDP-glycerol glycerophosphotransferase (TagB/SpsB family)